MKQFVPNATRNFDYVKAKPLIVNQYFDGRARRKVEKCLYRPARFAFIVDFNFLR